MERNEIIETCIPISLRNRTSKLTLSECLITLDAVPTWREDELNQTQAMDGACYIRNRLQELLEQSYSLYHYIEEDSRPDGLLESLQEALELL